MFRSMDDTALLAVGILLEEAADEVLGETGDMVFVEGVRVGETQKQRMPQREREHTDVIDEVQQPQDEDEKPPAKKRRRTKKDKGKKRALDLDDSGQGHDLEI